MDIIVLTFKLGCPFNVEYSFLAMRVEANCRCFCFRSFSAQVCGPTILVILNFPVTFCFQAQTIQLQSAFSHTTVYHRSTWECLTLNGLLCFKEYSCNHLLNAGKTLKTKPF
jgi:hypothetical protein